jgi:hypothetical protein
MIEGSASERLVAQVEHLDDLRDAGGDRGPVRHHAALPLVEPLIAGNLAGSCRDEKAARLTDCRVRMTLPAMQPCDLRASVPELERPVRHLRSSVPLVE